MATPTANPPAAPATGLRQFTFPFWLINAIELVERGAYYGMTSIVTFHLVTQRGFSTSFVGLMLAVLVAFAYAFPVIAAALAEKWGYRRSLIGCFALATVGYIGLGASGTLQAMLGDLALLPGVLLLGVGAGTFKPIVTAVIARSTTEGQRNFGFTIYYAFINIGGFLGPLLVGLLVPEALYGAVFYGAAAFSVLNLAIILLLYRDVAQPQADRSVAEALRTVAGVRRDPLFLALLVAYAGLWYMYAQTLYFLPLYMTDFAVMPSWFTVPLVLTINPGVIILAGPLVGRALSGFASLPVVIAGLVIYAVGILLLGLVPMAPLFLLGVVIVSIAEVMAHPSFLSYASKVAPPDRVAVYLGYAFVPVGAGLVLGTSVGGVLYADLVERLHQPALFWGVTAAIGAASVAGMLLVHRRLAHRGEAPAKATASRAERALAHRAAPFAALLLVPLLLLAGAAPGAQVFLREGAGPGLDPSAAPAAALREAGLAPITGEAAEGEETVVAVEVPEARAANLTFTLRWRDEAAPVPVAANQPDTFTLEVHAPGGAAHQASAANPPNGEGVLVVEVPAGASGFTDGAYEVHLGLDAGDTVLGPGVALSPDTGNAWTLEVAWRAP